MLFATFRCNNFGVLDPLLAVVGAACHPAAALLNHSCAPNAYSKIVEVGARIQDKHIIVFAARDLVPGEELQYDYQFALGGEKIACHCGAPNCWGRMN